jgi:lysophospholipase L1-like esterase
VITGVLVLAGGVVAVMGLIGTEVVLAGGGLILTEYDPGLADGRIEPTDPPSTADAVEPLRVTWIGDSTAAGVGSSSADESVSRQVGRRLADELDRPVDVQVVAVSGARVADVVASQLSLVDPEADVVFISVGANDTTHLTSSGTFADDYRTMLDGLPDGGLVMCHPGFVDETLESLDPLTSQREAEHAYLASDRFPTLLAANRVTLS